MRKLLLGAATTAIFLASFPARAETAATDAFVANIRLNAFFLASSSELAVGHSENAALKAFAGTEALAEAGIVSVLDERAPPAVGQISAIQSVSTKVATNDLLTGRSVAVDVPKAADAYSAPAGTGALMPAAMVSLNQLSKAEGEAFDALYKATQVNALLQLAAFYNAYGLTGDNVSLKQMAKEQLAAVNGRIAEIGRL